MEIVVGNIYELAFSVSILDADLGSAREVVDSENCVISRDGQNLLTLATLVEFDLE